MKWIVAFLSNGLSGFHSYFGNWGLAIVGLTLLVRLAFFPLQAFAVSQREKLAAIKSELDGLREKWPKDPARLWRETADLKSRHGVKSIASLVGAFLQIPIFFGMYRMIAATQALGGVSFLWILNLAAPDAFYILPLCVALASMAYMKLTEKHQIDNPILKWMPVVSFAFMARLPAALVLYYAVGGVVQLIGEVVAKRIT